MSGKLEMCGRLIDRIDSRSQNLLQCAIHGVIRCRRVMEYGYTAEMVPRVDSPLAGWEGAPCRRLYC